MFPRSLQTTHDDQKKQHGTESELEGADEAALDGNQARAAIRTNLICADLCGLVDFALKGALRGRCGVP